MEPLVERLLYITLLVVFIGLGVGIYAVINLDQKLNHELRATHAVALQNEQLSEQLQASVGQLKQSNDQQTVYIQCLLAAQHVTQFGSLPPCQSPVTVSEAPEKAQASASTHNTPSPSSTSQTAPTQPTPQSKPSTMQRLQNFINALLFAGSGQ